MDDVFLIFSSSTTANRIRKLAAREGIRGLRVAQTPKVLSAGCSYCLRCPAASLEAVCGIAEEYGASTDRRFREVIGEDGKKTYEMVQ